MALNLLPATDLRIFNQRSTTIRPGDVSTQLVSDGPFRLSRNPIYLGMFLGLIGLAIASNTIWILVALVAFYLVIRYGVIAREEAYLTRKFGDLYRGYQAQVRRWL